MQSHTIRRLKSLHARAELQLIRELKSRLPNGVEVVRLKKIKLAVKDRIAALSAAKTTPQTT
jgi:hypothetical protein